MLILALLFAALIGAAAFSYFPVQEWLARRRRYAKGVKSRAESYMRRRGAEASAAVEAKLSDDALSTNERRFLLDVLREIRRGRLSPAPGEIGLASKPD